MPFQYHPIKSYRSRADEQFIFDANVWIFYQDQINFKSYQRPYTAFLNNLLKGPADPHILLPACVLSEVLNRLLKGVYFEQFLQSQAGRAALIANPVNQGEEFKKVYRQHLKFKQDRDSIYQSIFSYSSNLELISDDFDVVGIGDLTSAMTDLDFTDWNIYELAKFRHATIVTDDSDFVLENYPIVTNNKNLLALN